METYARSIHQVDAPRIDISRESLISLLQRLRKIPQGTHHFVHSAGWLLRSQRFCQSHRLFRFDAFLKHAAQDCKRCVPAGSGDTPLRVLIWLAFSLAAILSIPLLFLLWCISDACLAGLQLLCRLGSLSCCGQHPQSIDRRTRCCIQKRRHRGHTPSRFDLFGFSVGSDSVNPAAISALLHL